MSASSPAAEPDHRPISDEALLARLPGLPITRDNVEHYRGYFARRLLINRCRACDRWHHPPRSICPDCWSADVAPAAVSGRGRIYLMIRLHLGPPAPGVDYTRPHPVATVELAEQPGLRFSSTLADLAPDGDLIGRRVSLRWIDRAGTPWPAFALEGAA